MAADYNVVAKQILSLLNAQGITTAYPTSATDIGDDRRNSGEIKEAIVEADLEARLAICETPGNGFRFLFTDFAALTPLTGTPQTAKLPERVGPISRVEIKVNAADTEWVAGEQCPLSEIREILASAGAYQGVVHDAVNSPLGGYFYIDEMADFITWTGKSIRVYYATVGGIDRVSPVIRTPDEYSPYLVARGLALLLKRGDDPVLFNWYDRQAQGMMTVIRQGAKVLPQLEPIIRDAA